MRGLLAVSRNETMRLQITDLLGALDDHSAPSFVLHHLSRNGLFTLSRHFYLQHLSYFSHHHVELALLFGVRTLPFKVVHKVVLALQLLFKVVGGAVVCFWTESK